MFSLVTRQSNVMARACLPTTPLARLGCEATGLNSVLVAQPNRQFFFFRRLTNKQIKGTNTNTEKQYESTAYLTAMKRFQRETKGLLRDSPEWNEVRNNIYADLRNQKFNEQQSQMKQTGQTVNDSSQTLDVSSYYNILVVNHEEVASYETLNILNYFGFPINVEEEDYVRTSRKQFDFSKHDDYPFLIINSSHEEMPGCDIAGKDNILAFLFKNSLISEYRNYGAYERQGLEFVDDKMEPLVDELLKDWRTLAQFHMRPKHFKQGSMSIEGHTNIKLYVFKLAIFLRKIITNDRASFSKAETYEQIQTVLDEFVDRMTIQGDKNFHGGEIPDAADFRAFSVLQKIGHTFVMHKVFSDREDRTLHNWYSAMKRLCQPKTRF